MESKLSEVNNGAVSRGQNELIGEFKMLDDGNSIGGQVMKYMYIPTGIKREQTTWKRKYRNMDNTINRKRKGKFLPKNEEISG